MCAYRERNGRATAEHPGDHAAHQHAAQVAQPLVAADQLNLYQGTATPLFTEGATQVTVVCSATASGPAITLAQQAASRV